MNKTLQYISLSHHTAPLDIRQMVHFNEEETGQLYSALPRVFPDISGLLILSTCNRSEIYFESESTHPLELIQYCLQFKQLSGEESWRQYFQFSENTIEAVHHLLRVGSGLHSVVTGDAQIISQIRMAYQQAQKMDLQGTLLERAVQALFKMHKRVSNETDFRSGSASTAFQALKAIRYQFGRERLPQSHLLIIGMGEIGQEVLRYVTKFGFQSVFLSNRTEEKAEKLATQYGFRTWTWDKVRENDFTGMDAIIAGVSNCPALIHTWPANQSKKVIVDLGMPGNVSTQLQPREDLCLVNLDQLQAYTGQAKEERQGAISQVAHILQEELAGFNDWYRKLPVRSFLQHYHTHLQTAIAREIQTHHGTLLDAQLISKMSEQLSRKLVRQPARTLNQWEMNETQQEQLQRMIETFCQ